jgi:O-6-methylguanine DNA methyltransferase
MIEEELGAYYAGTLCAFKTPIMLVGTDFQVRVWQALQTIAFGKTCSYRDIAQHLQMSRGYRAVAQAANANPLAIIVPCHRMINANGTLGGYACRKERKQLLFDAERSEIFL